MNLSFQEKKAVCKSVAWFPSYSNSRDTGEFSFPLTGAVYSASCGWSWKHCLAAAQDLLARVGGGGE